jgi:hypothetical protein
LNANSGELGGQGFTFVQLREHTGAQAKEAHQRTHHLRMQE